jgi:hypothetical protein
MITDVVLTCFNVLLLYLSQLTEEYHGETNIIIQ